VHIGNIKSPNEKSLGSMGLSVQPVTFHGVVENRSEMESRLRISFSRPGGRVRASWTAARGKDEAREEGSSLIFAEDRPNFHT
jgi:hypothetical protein